MNKAQLVEKIAKDLGWSRRKSEQVLDCCLDNIKKAVKSGESVKIMGFGTFTKEKRKGRIGRNPKTGTPLEIPTSNYPKFKPGEDFKSLLK